MARRALLPIADRGPLRVMFMLTSMPVGGAETLLVNLMRRMDPSRFLPELCCLKELGPLGQELAQEVPASQGLLNGKYDLRVLPRLVRRMRQRRVDAVVTVGAGDKMFWGRLAGAVAGVPVILSALHSTGWPDGVGRLNRRLTRWTDAFIAVAAAHGQFLHEFERFPREKVCVIPNGVDTRRFAPQSGPSPVRRELSLAEQAPVVGIVAALRPEKNHALFLRAAAQVRRQLPAAQFLIVGDGPERAALEALCAELQLNGNVHFLGTRSDIPEILNAMDVFLLTSHNEANPVSILEALACGKPVVAPDVGSIAEVIVPGRTGWLTRGGQEAEVADRVVSLLADRRTAQQMGAAGRADVDARWSLEQMVRGYEDLITAIYGSKCPTRSRQGARAAQAEAAGGLTTGTLALAAARRPPGRGCAPEA